MSGDILLLLKKINICLGAYENEKLINNDLTFSQVFLLNELLSMDSPCICSSELSDRMGFTRPAISRTLKELKKNGYVKMIMDEDDNRKKHILLTPKAYAVKCSIKNYMENLNKCLIQKIPERNLEGIENTLRTILDNIQQKH